MSRVVLISGGASGIGAATAERFLAAGDTVYVLDIQAGGIAGVHYLLCDIRDIDAISRAVNQIHQKALRIDVLVNNAGIHFSGTIEQTSVEDFYEVLQLNVTGAFFLLKTVVPLMREQGGGAVVMVGSDQTAVAKPSSSLYAATKGFIAQLTRGVAIDYAKHNIKVNCVCPGTIDTPLYRRAIEKYHQRSGVSYEQIHAEENAAQPIGRIGTASEVAETIFFLANRDIAFMTGAMIAVDGGATAD